MLLLTIRTDKPEAEIGLFEADQQITYVSWTAHRELAETLHLKLVNTLKTAGKSLEDIEGIVFFSGPGSFTGLRIGASVCNSLAYSLGVPLIGASGTDWVKSGIKNLTNGKNDKVILPKYSSTPHITHPRK